MKNIDDIIDSINENYVPEAEYIRYYLGKVLLRAITSLYYNAVVEGRENEPEYGCLYAAHHLRHSDPAFAGCWLKGQPYFMAKKELFEMPVLKNIIKSYRAIPIGRNNFSKKQFMFFRNILASGDKLVIFPEGTRRTDGKFDFNVNEGAARIWVSANKERRRSGLKPIPLVPVAISYEPSIFRYKSLFFVSIGKPLHLEEVFDENNKDYKGLSIKIMKEISSLAKVSFGPLLSQIIINKNIEKISVSDLRNLLYHAVEKIGGLEGINFDIRMRDKGFLGKRFRHYINWAEYNELIKNEFGELKIDCEKYFNPADKKINFYFKNEDSNTPLDEKVYLLKLMEKSTKSELIISHGSAKHNLKKEDIDKREFKTKEDALDNALNTIYELKKKKYENQFPNKIAYLANYIEHIAQIKEVLKGI